MKQNTPAQLPVIDPVKDFTSKYPPELYDKKEFNFTISETTRVSVLETIAVQYQQFLRQNDNDLNFVLNNIVLPRVGIIPTKETGILYDTARGKFYVFIPKKPANSDNKVKTKDTPLETKVPSTPEGESETKVSEAKASLSENEKAN